MSREFIDDDFFRNEVAPILSRHMLAAKTPEQHAAIYEALASFLGNAVAQGCGGDPKTMGIMLEGLSNHMMVVASERQPVMEFLTQFRN